jgi:hypothetical protein
MKQADACINKHYLIEFTKFIYFGAYASEGMATSRTTFLKRDEKRVLFLFSVRDDVKSMLE